MTARERLGVAVFVRHLDGGSSGLAEAELVALAGAAHDLPRHGIVLVASPVHANVLLVTGPLTLNMVGPAAATWRAMPEPKCVVTAGEWPSPAAAPGAVPPLSAQLLAGSYATTPLPDDLAAAVVAHAAGDPPSPAELVEALRRAGRHLAGVRAPRRSPRPSPRRGLLRRPGGGTVGRDG